MKKFLARLAAFVAIQMAILVFVTTYGSMDSCTNEYMYCLKDKYDLLVETPSPRIIFIGGSNLAFGLKSGQLKQETGLNPVNMGVHGRLGVTSMIRMVKDNLHPGDLVVVSPEYSAMFNTPECNRELAIEAVRIWPGCQRFIQPDIDEPLATLVPPTTPLRKLGQSVVRARNRLQKIGSHSDKHTNGESAGIYLRRSFNRFGDLIAHYQAEPTYRENGKLLHMDDKVFKRVAHELNTFAQFCQTKNAKLYFLHPPISVTKVSNNVEQIHHIDQLMTAMLSFPLLTNVEMATFADDQFFDGQSHLTEQGAKLRTDIVCQQIRQFQRIAGRSDDSMVR